jgi:hypothetical protein
VNKKLLQVVNDTDGRPVVIDLLKFKPRRMSKPRRSFLQFLISPEFYGPGMRHLRATAEKFKMKYGEETKKILIFYSLCKYKLFTSVLLIFFLIHIFIKGLVLFIA